MTDVRPEDVLVPKGHYRIAYRDALEPSGSRSFKGEFVEYVADDDLCIFVEDTAARVPRAIVWSTEMITVEVLDP